MRSLAQPCEVNNTFSRLWEGQKWGFFPKDRKYRAFLHNKLFFLIAPRDLHYYWASAQPSEVNNSFLRLWEGQKWRFSLRIAHIAPFYTINFFSDSPEGFALLLGQCAALRSLAQSCEVNNTFFRLWEGQKWGFFPKDRTERAFLHNKLFFLIAPRDLHYYWASAQPCAALRS